MAANSKIGWTDHTFNPWVGCTKISPGCDNCYAEAWSKRGGHPELWQGERRRTKTWGDPVKWNKAAKALGVRQKVFCASLADWLDNQVPMQWRDDLAYLIDTTPHLDWLLLTKRPENWGKLSPWHEDSIPNNVWIGITAENQDRFDHRWGYIKDFNCTRFVSYEPAIGPLSQREWTPPDWIICGAESGRNRRPFDTNWARSLRDECRSGGIAFFYKQDWIDGKLVEGPELDGRQWLEFPKSYAIAA